VDTIVICDTEPVAIEGLRSLLETAEGLRVIATEISITEAMDAVRELQPSILVVDRAFGAHAVRDWITTLQNCPWRTATIVWGNSLPETEAVRYLHSGAAGAVRKSASLESLLRCIRAVQAGGTWMDEEMLREDRPVRAVHSHLTARELQVMELVERGMKNREIGVTLGIRAGTVKIHLKHIFEKTGIRGRYGLTLSALKERGLSSLATVE
jgi:DNA-binding NarL/FixJ family response regulator